MSALDFAARAKAVEARLIAVGVSSTAEAARTAARQAEGKADAAQAAADLVSASLETSRKEIEGASAAAKAAGETAGAASKAAQVAERLAQQATASAPRLFANLVTAGLPASVSRIDSTGHDADGHGAASYISDKLANAALAEAHPLACFAGEGGRFFRLMPSADGSITPEQLGCPTYAPGVNMQPYIQAALDYAGAIGVSNVHLTQTRYELWCPIRPKNVSVHVSGGDFIVFRYAVRLIGRANTQTKLILKNSEGGSTNIVTQSGMTFPEDKPGQNYDNSQWIGNGMRADPIRGVPTSHYGTIDFLRVENIELDGGFTDWTLGNGTEGRNLSNKGIHIGGIAIVKKIELVNFDMHDFGGELYYTAGSKNIEEEYFENVHIHGSPQCALNPQTYARGTYINCRFGRSYQNEIIGGRGKRFIGCVFYDLQTCAIMGGAAGSEASFQNGYGYSWPFRDADKNPPYVYLDGLTFVNCTSVTLYSYLRGKVYAVDTYFALGGGSIPVRDVSMEIEATWDKRPGLAPVIAVAGPQNAVTRGASPEGVFIEPTRDIHIKVSMRRTKEAVANGVGYHTGVQFSGGLFDASTCTFSVEGDGRLAVRATSYPDRYPAPASPTAESPTFSWPKVEVSPSFRHFGSFNSFGTEWRTSPAADFSFALIPGNNVLYPSANGTFVMTVTVPYRFQHGQKARIYHGQPTTGRIIKLPRSGSSWRLKEDRYLIAYCDYIELQWDGGQNVFVESEYHTTAPLVMKGQKVYDAPSIAPGASTTTTVSVPGALAADIVTSISFGPVSTAGLTVTGTVTADNTVTVTLTNLTATAIDLASATVKVQVAKGFAA